MSRRIAGVTGNVTTTIAGAMLGALSVSAFGVAPTLVGFVTLFVLASVTHALTVRR